MKCVTASETPVYFGCSLIRIVIDSVCPEIQHGQWRSKVYIVGIFYRNIVTDSGFTKYI